MNESDTDLNEEQKEMFKDMRMELSKFGPISTMKLALAGDNKEKVLVSFHNLASAFVCYNLLNGKIYLGHKVSIVFIM